MDAALRLAILLSLLYVVLPLYLYMFCIEKRKEKLCEYRVRKKPLFGSWCFLLLLLSQAGSWEDHDIALTVSTILLFVFVKVLRFSMMKFDESVLQSFDYFLLFFVIPSSVRFDDAVTGTRWEGCKIIAFGMVELAVSFLYLLFWRSVFSLFPQLFDIPRLDYVIQSVVVYLHIRGILNGTLIGGTKILFGNGIVIDETWSNLAYACSIRELWKGWNCGVHDGLRVCLFLPLRAYFSSFSWSRLTGTILALFITFLCSGCLHEYTIWVQRGVLHGNQLIFFLLQFLGILLERAIGITRLTSWKRQILGRIFLFSWLGATLPFFMAEIGQTMEEFFSHSRL